MGTNESLVSLDGAGMYRNGRWLVRDISFEVGRGEIVTLIGPNGSGKSTSARMALGLVKLDAGTATQRPGLKVGYVPQNLMVDWSLPLTVSRFMHLTGRPANEDVAAALEETGVAHLEKASVQHLSGGEFQRVLLARAIAGKPDLLVLDEPVQGVDFNGEIAIYQLIQAIRERLGCGVLMISHDLHVVMAATDRVICLNGHICCHGSPVAVAGSPSYRELFGVPAANALAVYEHHHDHLHRLDGTVADVHQLSAGCTHDHERASSQLHHREHTHDN